MGEYQYFIIFKCLYVIWNLLVMVGIFLGLTLICLVALSDFNPVFLLVGVVIFTSAEVAPINSKIL